MIKKIDKNQKRLHRHKRIFGTTARPRLSVYRSTKNIYAQIIDDEKAITLVSFNSLMKDFEGDGGNKAGARMVGEKIAKLALEKGITEVVFDRGGNLYHGRVAELADGARDGGLKF